MRRELESELTTAMKARDELRVATLRLVLAAIKDRDIAARGEQAAAPDDDDIRELLARMIRQREESAAIYERGGRLELAERERREIDIIREFLPTPLSDAEMRLAIDAAIAETGAGSLRDMGRVMALLKERYPARIDLAAAGKAAKARLQK